MRSALRSPTPMPHPGGNTRGHALIAAGLVVALVLMLVLAAGSLAHALGV